MEYCDVLKSYLKDILNAQKTVILKVSNIINKVMYNMWLPFYFKSDNTNQREI